MFLFIFFVYLWVRDIGKDFWLFRYKFFRVMEYKVFIDFIGFWFYEFCEVFLYSFVIM